MSDNLSFFITFTVLWKQLLPTHSFIFKKGNQRK
nr:MAG TPA: hypothetical protein [Caudoviricetes sp.]DAS03496.1 MAG TPA: hypothetical protein [Caudoviricetes sp.]